MTDLNSIDISTISDYSYDGIITDCKIINIYNPNSISVLMNINNKTNIFNIRMNGYHISKKECCTCYKKIKLSLFNLLTSCGDLINLKMSENEIQDIIQKNNKKILKIHLMKFYKYNQIYARLYLDDQKKFVDEIILDEYEC